jgi:hypothetical protein
MTKLIKSIVLFVLSWLLTLVIGEIITIGIMYHEGTLEDDKQERRVIRHMNYSDYRRRD